METNIITTEQETERPFVCEICNRRFMTKANLVTHQKFHDENYISPSAQKRLKKLEEYHKAPERCKQCNSPIPYNKLTTKKTDRKKMKRARSLKGKPPKEYNFFCGSSCAAIYNNTHKTHGNRKSKLECFIEKHLKELYPTLKFCFNEKDAIESELDIYVPILKVAFEINGIFHYQPIHGEKKLSEIQSNDCKKAEACIQKGIELYTIDSSKLSYFTYKNAEKYLKIVTDVIDEKIKTNSICLEKLPIVIYSDQSKSTQHRECKHCKELFVLLDRKNQMFCKKSCADDFRLKDSKVYQHIMSQKQKVIEGLQKNLSIISVGRSIGFKSNPGDFYNILKRVISDIKKESAQ